MRVLFDAFWYVSGPPSQRHVLREMVQNWRREFPDDEITMLCRRKDAPAVLGEFGTKVISSRLWPHGLMIILLTAFAARKSQSQVVFSHNFTGPTRAFAATFIHDFLFLDHPEWFTFAERRYFRFMKSSARWSDLVFTSSLTEAARIRSHLSGREVIPVGIGMSAELVNAESDQEIQSRLELTAGRFLLTVGRLNVRKNLELSLLAALDSGVLTSAFPMVVVGEKNGKTTELPARIVEAVSDGRIVFAGFVSDGQLKWLYQNANLFVFLSLGEGFGMPPLEARFLGTRTLVSDLPVFRETLGAHSFYVDPTSRSVVASRIRELAGGQPGGIAHTEFRTYRWDMVVTSIRTAVEHRLSGKVCEGQGQI